MVGKKWGMWGISTGNFPLLARPMTRPGSLEATDGAAWSLKTAKKHAQSFTMAEPIAGGGNQARPWEPGPVEPDHPASSSAALPAWIPFEVQAMGTPRARPDARTRNGHG